MTDELQHLTPTIALVHAGAACFMAGLIWFVQVVHYPLFAKVGHAGFAHYEAAHAARTSWVVGPGMLIELSTGAWLAVALPEARTPALLGLGMLAAIWLSTFLVQVPLHNRLARGFDPGAQRRLVATNWVRTALWSARVPVAFMLL
jgi:hypothetical protein